MFETVSDIQATTSGTMPYTRRKRPHLTSTVTNQIEVQGTTYLCFPLDHCWFQGNINTDDESSYSLYGERVSPDPQVEEEIIKPEEENNNLSEDEGSKVIKTGDLDSNLQKGYYKVVLTDHFTGLSYHLPKIGVNIKNNMDQPSGSLNNGTMDNMFTCTDSDADVKFKVENIYKGQKADMVLQKNLGSSRLDGQKSLVYSGPIRIVFNEIIENGRSWCL